VTILVSSLASLEILLNHWIQVSTFSQIYTMIKNLLSEEICQISYKIEATFWSLVVGKELKMPSNGFPFVKLSSNSLKTD